MAFIKFVFLFFVLVSKITSGKDRYGEEYGKCDEGDCYS